MDVCTTCFQRVRFSVRVEGEWRVMTCPNCGQEYRERAPRQRDHNPGKDRERVERSKGKTR